MLPASIRDRLTLPVICAPMFLVSGPNLVRAACASGVIGGLPSANARSLEEFEQWLSSIRRDLDARSAQPGARVGPMAVNLSTRMAPDDIARHLEICRQNSVDIIITAVGDPTEMIRRVHDWGGKLFHDITNLRFAEKAIAAGVDGITCIGAGGGGHSGTISHLALIPRVREMFDGIIAMAGAVSTGAVIRAAEILGADLAYMGTRFTATRESDAPEGYKRFLVSETSADLLYTGKIGGVPANWLVASIRENGLDPTHLPEPLGRGMRHDHLPENVKPWKTLWSAGQGIDLIHDIPSVADLVLRLRQEYVNACEKASMADAARLVDMALDARSAH